MGRRKKLAAANLQAESYVKHVASRTPQAVFPANAWTLLLPRSILERGQLNP